MISEFKIKIIKFYNFLGKQAVCFALLGLILSVFNFMVEMSFVYIIQGVLLILGLAPKASSILPPWYPVDALSNLVLLVMFGLLRCLTGIGSSYFQAIASEAFRRRQRGRIIYYSLDYSSTRSTGNIISSFTEEMIRAGNLIDSSISFIVNSIVTICFLVFTLNLAWKETLIGIIFLSIFYLPVKYLNSIFSHAGKKISKDWQDTTENFISAMKNKVFLNFYSLTTQETNSIKTHLKSYESTYRNYMLAVYVQGFFPNFIGVMAICLICFCGLKYFNTPGEILFSFFYVFIRMVQSSVLALGGISGMIYNFPAIKNIFNISEESVKTQIKNVNENSECTKNFNDLDKIKISYKNITFGYGSNRNEIFNNFNLLINSNDILLIKGASGSGKSTLVLLLLGLVEPVSGAIYINNIPIKKLKYKLSEFISYVGPEPFLIAGTIRENLVYGHPNSCSITEIEMYEALDLACLKSDINQLPGKIDYYLNEHAGISTGQKQRLSIARALLRDSKIYIFDECTANLDFITEKKVLINIRKKINNNMAIVISHRPAFDDMATRLIDLDKK